MNKMQTKYEIRQICPRKQTPVGITISIVPEACEYSVKVCGELPENVRGLWWKLYSAHEKQVPD